MQVGDKVRLTKKRLAELREQASELRNLSHPSYPWMSFDENTIGTVAHYHDGTITVQVGENSTVWTPGSWEKIPSGNPIMTPREDCTIQVHKEHRPYTYIVLTNHYDKHIQNVCWLSTAHISCDDESRTAAETIKASPEAMYWFRFRAVNKDFIQRFFRPITTEQMQDFISRMDEATTNRKLYQEILNKNNQDLLKHIHCRRCNHYSMLNGVCVRCVREVMEHVVTCFTDPGLLYREGHPRGWQAVFRGDLWREMPTGEPADKVSAMRNPFKVGDCLRPNMSIWNVSSVALLKNINEDTRVTVTSIIDSELITIKETGTVRWNVCRFQLANNPVEGQPTYKKAQSLLEE